MEEQLKVKITVEAEVEVEKKDEQIFSKEEVAIHIALLQENWS
jgi:hypothetical protein